MQSRLTQNFRLNIRLLLEMTVPKFDSRLRNEIAHNDIVVRPSEKVVEIPTKQTRITYADFSQSVEESIANLVFLIGASTSVIVWHVGTSGSDFRSPRPDWVFGNPSLSTEFLEQIRPDSNSGIVD